MNTAFENFKRKVQQLLNQYNAGNFRFVVQQINLLLKKQPNNLFILNLLGSSYHKLRELNVAKKVFFRVIDLDKNNLAALNNLANVYKDLSEYKEAEKLYKKILQLDPNYINAIGNYGSLKYELNLYQESIELYKNGLKINKDSLIINYNMGLVYQALGSFKEAEFYFREVIRINPNMNIVDRMMSRFIKYSKNSSHLIEMLKKIENNTLNDESKINLNFAIGKAYEDLSEFKKSFFYLNEGNKIKNTISNYNIESDNHLFNNIKKTFKDFNFNNKAFKSNSDKKIIFILGLPRSGTSLIEQIVSSHPEVYGSGELDFLEKLIRITFYKDNNFKISNLEDQNNIALLNKISLKYSNLIDDFKISQANVTDKAPLNFRWIGFIKILFPNAKIIHCNRDAKDNCLSLYKNIFDENQNWTYNKSNLFAYYQNYHELMNFWNSKLPNFIYNCKYEDLIANSEIEIQKLIKFCALDWDDNCLKFYKSKRAIKTVSLAQARQPLYNSSISSYKNFEPFLSDLFSRLDDLLL